MGYITEFELSLIGEPDNVSEFNATLIKKVEEDDDSHVDDVKELIDYGYVSGKLYDLEDWIVYVARENPDVLVILKGYGEDQDDMWEMRVKGEDYEKKYAIIPPFENKNLLLPKEIEQLNK